MLVAHQSRNKLSPFNRSRLCKIKCTGSRSIRLLHPRIRQARLQPNHRTRTALNRYQIRIRCERAEQASSARLTNLVVRTSCSGAQKPMSLKRILVHFFKATSVEKILNNSSRHYIVGKRSPSLASKQPKTNREMLEYIIKRHSLCCRNRHKRCP